MFASGYRNILVVGAGGGGDIVTASVFALKLRRLGFNTYISAPPWERIVVDSVPGPIGLDEVRNFVSRGDYYLVIDGSSYAVRGGKRVVFQASNVSRAVGEPIYIYSLRGGVEDAYRGLRELCGVLSIDLVVGLDVGGDILAKGFEDDLWSPLADQMTLSTLYRLASSDSIPSIIAVASPGADGELSREYVLERINELARLDGFIGALGFDRDDLEVFERILSYAITEAGQVILDALRGNVGWRVIRNGTRKVYIDVLSTIIFLLDTVAVYHESPVASAIIETKSIEEANQILLEMGIPTEYELEKEVARLSAGGEINGDIIRRARENILEVARKRK